MAADPTITTPSRDLKQDATAHRPDPKGMPGGRAALPAGSLKPPFFGPQGDENRTPPANAPSPVTPATTVKREVDDAAR